MATEQTVGSRTQWGVAAQSVPWGVAAQWVLVPRALVAIPDVSPAEHAIADEAGHAAVVTNIAYYGYALSSTAYSTLTRLDRAQLTRWWAELEPLLATLTGDDRQMADFVVYQNFPAEVLAMDEADYWTRQILMYWGLPKELVREEPAARSPLTDAPAPRVLHLADHTSLPRIREALHAVPARWTDDQWQDVRYLLDLDEPNPVDVAGVAFVENRIRLTALVCERGGEVSLAAATDVLRLAAALSGGDVSLRERCRLRRFSRPERRFMLGLLERATHLLEDVGRRRELFKRLLRELHPGDYQQRYPRVCHAYDLLYRGASLPGHNAEVERLLAAGDQRVLEVLSQRPGEFARRLRVLVLLFGDHTVAAFSPVASRLGTLQLLKLAGYLKTADSRRWRLFPPRGNWSRIQIVPNSRPRQLRTGTRNALLATIDAELAGRLAATAPVALAPEVARVKLPTNDAELAPYGRGTRFPIPDEVTFVRTAVYWRSGPTQQNIWYDNGWNMFTADWKSLGACCWNAALFPPNSRPYAGAVFAGDPTNRKDLDGRACQLIDLNLKQLAVRNVRYAVWSVLCYSRIMFSAAEEVFAAVQWGERPQDGKLFEPSRCQLAFPLAGQAYTKFVAYLDLTSRELVYLDANLPVQVSSAAANGQSLSTTMPAYLEYLTSLPSVHDLYRHAPADPAGMPVRYDDSGVTIKGGPAYVFRPSNRDNAFDPIDPAILL